MQKNKQNAPKNGQAPKSGYEARAQRTRERLLQFASKRFMSKGFSSVRMGDIASELGMGKSTIYRHFSSKEELVNEVVERFFTQMEKKAEHLTESSGTAQERAARLTKGISQELHTVSIAFLEDLQKLQPDIYKKLSQYRYQLMRTRIEQIVEQGQSEGNFCKDIPTYVISSMVWASIEHMLQPEFLYEHNISYPAMIEWVLTVVFRGIEA